MSEKIDNDILKALKLCNGGDCENCKALNCCKYEHSGALAHEAYKIIMKQSKKIESLR